MVYPYQVAKHLKVLENRLELAEKKFCETLTRNKGLREEVEDLNKGKAAFEQVGVGITVWVLTYHRYTM